MRKKNMACRFDRFGVGFSATLVAFACAMPGLARADAADAFNFALGTSATYDDNLFRLPSGTPVPVSGKSSRSEITYATYAGVRVDKAYSLQRFQLDMTATRYEHRTYDFLNFSALDYRAAWLWSLTPQLTGSISAARTEALTSYADFNSQNRSNVQTNETQRFMADWWVGGAWHLTGGAYKTRTHNTAAFTSVGNFTQDTAEAGIKYVSAADNSLAVVNRQSRGEYSDRTLGDGSLLDTRYDQSETEVRALWRTSGHSSLDARLGYLDRTHDHYAQRDYSGAVGSLSYIWTPTGKLQLTLATGRDLVSFQNAASSYYVSDYFSLIPAWLVSEKTTIRLKLDLSQHDYRGAINAVSFNREDRIRTSQLRATWKPTRTIDVDGYLTHEQRSSNTGGLDYRDNIVGISAALLF